MGTPIRLEKLKAVLASTAEPEVRVRIAALEILSAAKPQLKYFSNFVTLARYCSGTRGLTPYDRKSWPLSECSSKRPNGIHDNTRVRQLEILVSRTDEALRRNARRRWEKSWDYTKTLLITQAGELLVWDLAVYHFRKGGKKTAAVRSKFRVLKGRSLMTNLSNAQTARAVIVALGWAATDTIEERVKRLARVRTLDEFIKEVEPFMF